MSLSKSDLIEAAWSLGVGLGEMSLDDLRKKAIPMTGCRKDVKYEDLQDNAKAAVDRIVNDMQESSGAFAKILKATAKLTRLQYDALIAEGFNEAQALQIVCSQGSSPSQ
jgi:predicted nucleic acid-binding OB-fold protein